MLFRRLAVFVGGCTLEAAEAVAHGDRAISASSVVRRDRLAGRQEPAAPGGGAGRTSPLPDAGDGPRVRAGAAGGERRGRGHSATPTREYFLALAEQAEPELVGATTRRAGWTGWTPSTTTCGRPWPGRWSAADGEASAAAGRRAVAFWRVRGHLAEGASGWSARWRRGRRRGTGSVAGQGTARGRRAHPGPGRPCRCDAVARDWVSPRRTAMIGSPPTR